MMDHELETNTTEQVAILLAKEGDENAFRELYENNYQMVYRLAYRYSKSQQDAEDIMQETFIKAFKGIKKFDLSISGNFSSWIYRIGIHCSIDHLRKRKNRKTDQIASLADIYSEPQAQDPSPEKSAIANQTISHVKNAMNILSPKQRIIFDLRHLQHETLEEISEQLQCNKSTVLKHLQRAVSKLRKQIEPLWGEQ
jgi:RNA polymerase sigma-70 factor (ECF subfamily)